MDNTPELGPAPSPDDLLDAAVEFTFPASDPIAIADAYESARRREELAEMRKIGSVPI
jgi:hypothetical protein